MSMVSMLAMEFTENVVTLGLSSFDAASMDVSSGHFWLVTGLSMVAGFVAPLPYNYWRLKLYGKACH